MISCPGNKLRNISGISVCILLTGLLTACTGKTEQQQGVTQASQQEHKVLSKPPASCTDTLVAQNRVAVFFNPDPGQLEKIRTINDTMVFESMTHDCYYQMNNARLLMKQNWPDIKIIESSNARFLKFTRKDKSSTCIDLNTINDMCGIVLFDGTHDPLLIDMMNVDTELERYFKRP